MVPGTAHRMPKRSEERTHKDLFTHLDGMKTKIKEREAEIAKKIKYLIHRALCSDA